MKTVLVLGAGRSSVALIEFLSSGIKEVRIHVADTSFSFLASPVNEHVSLVHMDARDTEKLDQEIGRADIVISMLPASMHPDVALRCLNTKKHLLTASYVSKDMAALHKQAESEGLLFLNECGLDPGLDHMTGMRLLNELRSKGAVIRSFESYAGGLISPETDPENPWRYKFTWNPRNVVLAGQGTARFLEDGSFKHIPYQRIFRTTRSIEVPSLGLFEAYPNRDSLQYRELYGLNGVSTLIRGTLRYPGFCRAWDTFVQLGCCDDSYAMSNVDKLTHNDYLRAFLSGGSGRSTEQKLSMQLGIDQQALDCLAWSGLFNDELVGIGEGTPARILEHILSKRWSLIETDRDMIVMVHRCEYMLSGETHVALSHLMVKGDDSRNTAMAKTVGLPLGIAAKLLLEDKIQRVGVAIPVTEDLYSPILSALAHHNIIMKENLG